MQMRTAFLDAGILRGDEIAILMQVYEEITRSPNYHGDESEREALASKLLRAYQSGVTDPTEIKKAISP